MKHNSKPKKISILLPSFEFNTFRLSKQKVDQLNSLLLNTPYILAKPLNLSIIKLRDLPSKKEKKLELKTNPVNQKKNKNKNKSKKTSNSKLDEKALLEIGLKCAEEVGVTDEQFNSVSEGEFVTMKTIREILSKELQKLNGKSDCRKPSLSIQERRNEIFKKIKKLSQEQFMFIIKTFFPNEDLLVGDKIFFDTDKITCRNARKIEKKISEFEETNQKDKNFVSIEDIEKEIKIKAEEEIRKKEAKAEIEKEKDSDISESLESDSNNSDRI